MNTSPVDLLIQDLEADIMCSSHKFRSLSPPFTREMTDSEVDDFKKLIEKKDEAVDKWHGVSEELYGKLKYKRNEKRLEIMKEMTDKVHDSMENLYHHQKNAVNFLTDLLKNFVSIKRTDGIDLKVLYPGIYGLNEERFALRDFDISKDVKYVMNLDEETHPYGRYSCVRMAAYEDSGIEELIKTKRAYNNRKKEINKILEKSDKIEEVMDSMYLMNELLLLCNSDLSEYTNNMIAPFILSSDERNSDKIDKTLLMKNRIRYIFDKTQEQVIENFNLKPLGYHVINGEKMDFYKHEYSATAGDFSFHTFSSESKVKLDKSDKGSSSVVTPINRFQPMNYVNALLTLNFFLGGVTELQNITEKSHILPDEGRTIEIS